MHPETVQVLRSISCERPAQASMSLDLGALPHAALSYSNAGEDMALRKLLKHRVVSQKGGAYIDVGCSAPVSMSNTYLFYSLGWRGVCIDPYADAAPYWKESRPQDILVTAAVGETEGTTTLFRHKTNLGMHTIGSTPPSPDFDDGITVPLRRLDSILSEHALGRQFQLMSIDVEGAELGVLKSNDWKRWRPEFIIIEERDFDMMNPAASAPIKFLLDLGYKLDSKVAANVVLRA